MLCKKSTFRFIVIMMLTFCYRYGMAQHSDSINQKEIISSKDLDEVVVTASRLNSLRIKTPEAIEILYSKSIQQYQLRTTPEALALTPGVFIQKTNHGGGSPFLRGLTGNQTLLLIDGIRLSNSTMRYGPNQYLNTIDVFSIEKLEILRGNGSVQYGSDAIGGTIQVFSPGLEFTDKPTWSSTLFSRIATQGMEESLHANVNYTGKKLSVVGGITRRNFGDLIGGDTTGRQTPSGYNELDFDLKGKVLLSKNSILTFLYQNVHQNNVPVFHKIVLENYDLNEMEPQRRELAYIRLNQKLKKGIFKSLVLTLSGQQSEEGRQSHKKGAKVIRFENDKVQTIAFTGEIFTEKGKIWSANSGIEVYSDLVHSLRTDKDTSANLELSKRGLYPEGSKMNSIAAFSLHTLDFNKWNVTLGARYNSYRISVDDTSLGKTILSPSALVGNIALLRKLSPSSNVFLSLNSGFRAPNIDDLGTLGIVDFRYETPNFSLKPEKSFQYQVGYKFHNPKVKGDIYFYRNELYNLIVRNPMDGDSIEGYPVYQKENMERAFIQGVESSLILDLTKAWTFNGHLTYTYGQNITKNEPVRRIPPLFGRFSTSYRYKYFWVNVEFLAALKQTRLGQGDIADNRIPDGGTPGWEVLNFHTGYTFRFVSVNLSLQNIFNEDYRYHGSGVNGYGRSAFLSLSVNL